MSDVKRRYQNVENTLTESSVWEGASERNCRNRHVLQQHRLAQIKHNVKNLHILGYFVLAVLACLYGFNLIVKHLEKSKSRNPIDDMKDELTDPSLSLYNLDLSYLSSMFNQQAQKRSSLSKLPDELASSVDLCDFDRISDDVLNSAIFDTKYRNKKPFILFFYQDLEAWSHPSTWTIPSLNRTFKDSIVQFGRSVDSDEELRETTFGNFLKNLIGETDLRGEPWQMRDAYLLNNAPHEMLKRIEFFPDEWVRSTASLHIGTILSSTGFKSTSNGATVLAVVKGRTRVFVYPSSVTPPAGITFKPLLSLMITL